MQASEALREDTAAPPLVRVVERVSGCYRAVVDRERLELPLAPQLKRELESLTLTMPELELDVGQVQFIDGSVIAVLVYLRDRLGEGGSLRLVNVTRGVAERLRQVDAFELLCR